MVANSRGRHRVRSGRELSGVAGSTGIALVAVALMGTTPVTANSVTLSANSAVYYLKGTEIGESVRLAKQFGTAGINGRISGNAPFDAVRQGRGSAVRASCVARHELRV